MTFSAKRRKQQDVQLRKTFLAFNDRFFAGEISLATVVEFKEGVYNPKEKEPGDAHYLPNEMRIQIDEQLRGRNRQYQLTLLHEMAHAWLYQVKEYVGWAEHGGHGQTFQGVICRLIQIGAYDGLL